MSTLNEPECRCQFERKAKPVSFPMEGDQRKQYSCLVESDKNLFQMHWEGDRQWPDLALFPTLSDAVVQTVQLSASITRVWATSEFVQSGVDACVRCLHTGPYPIVKIALPLNKEARPRLHYEYERLMEMSKLSLPIPKVDPEPLVDEDGIFGYKLERLSGIDFSDLGSRAKEVQAALVCLHDAGFAHGDLHPSNIMQNKDGEIRFIDFAFSGRLGQPVPSSTPSWVYNGKIIHEKGDTIYLARFFGAALGLPKPKGPWSKWDKEEE